MSMHEKELIRQLQEKSNRFRIEILDMICKVQSGHPGGTLSAVDILTCLYFHQMNIRPESPLWEDRDRFVLSKGHAAPALYAILSELGFFPREEIRNFRRIGSILQGHPDMTKTPGVDISTGSLGNGLSIGIGLALSARLLGKKYITYVLIGDGECDEGEIWEGAMAASKYRLDNLIVLLDFNRVQLDGPIEEIMPLEPLAEKWESFNWNTIRINGHNIGEILDALDEAGKVSGRPTIIIADTVKGCGVSFMENECLWHGRAPDKEELEKAIDEIRDREV